MTEGVDGSRRLRTPIIYEIGLVVEGLNLNKMIYLDE